MKKNFFSSMAIVSLMLSFTACSDNDLNDDTTPAYTVEPMEAVDLGLPSGTLWSTKNVGAACPEDYGMYFAWGDTIGQVHGQEPIRNFGWGSYKYSYDNGAYLTKYFEPYDTLEAIDDVATKKLGSHWRIPYDSEWTELRENCVWEWTTTYEGSDVKGYIVYKKKAEGEYTTADPHIFLPAAGYYKAAKRQAGGLYGHYWSANLKDEEIEKAWRVLINSSKVERSGQYRYCGHTIRAIYVP